MILHDNRTSVHVSLAREVPLFPARLEQAYEAVKLTQGMDFSADREFFHWWKKQCANRGIPVPSTSPENTVIVKRLLRKYDYATLKGAALMVLNNSSEPLVKGYRHHMRYLASQMPDALAMLARWEKKDG